MRNKKTLCFLYLGMLLLLYAPIASATVSISTETNAQTYSDIHVRSNGNATVEVSNTTVINGEEFSYHFSSSSPNSIEHQVRIENGVVTPEPLQVHSPIPEAPASIDVSMPTEERIVIESVNLPPVNEHPVIASTFDSVPPEETIIRWSWNDVIKYFYAYVQNLF